MNEKKIAIIICVNDECYYDECLYYLNQLLIPKDFTVELFAVSEAASIFEAYNEAMKQSDAKYKLYLHQDVFLFDNSLVSRCIDFFQSHSKVGLLGVLGGTKMPKNRRFYKAWDTGYVIACSEKKTYYNDLGRKCEKVKAIDGMFMMTQYDLPWREDIFKGWDFYDFSQSMEFQKAGYEVWTINSEKASVLHDCGYLNLCKYDRALDNFLLEYGENFPDYTEMPQVYPQEYQKQFAIRVELMECWKKLLFLGQEQEVRRLFQCVEDERFFSTEMVVLKNIFEIKDAEISAGVGERDRFLVDCKNYDDMYAKYQNAKFYLRRKRYSKNWGEVCFEISEVARKIIQKHCMPNQ